MDNITIHAPAKINLFLDILGVLEDGYHSLFMLMQTVSLCDTVEVSRRKSGIVLSCSAAKLPTDGRNIAHRAAEKFFAHTKIDGGCTISIEKRIPFEAGLGGGSADAAAVLQGLNALYGGVCTPQNLAKIGLELGADVPFALMGGTAIALNKGEVLAPLPPLPSRFCVIVKPSVGVSTVTAYRAYDALPRPCHPDGVKLTAAAANSDWHGVAAHAANVLEQCVEVVNRAQYKAILREQGAIFAQMTGSGSAIFGIFEEEQPAQNAAKALSEFDGRVKVFVVRTIRGDV